jgi:hypothetical protein
VRPNSSSSDYFLQRRRISKENMLYTVVEAVSPTYVLACRPSYREIKGEEEEKKKERKIKPL